MYRLIVSALGRRGFNVSLISSTLGRRGFNVRLIASALERRGSMSDLGEVRMLDVQLDSVSSRKEGFYCQIWVE